MTRGPYKSRVTPGSFADLIRRFYQSPTYRDWAPATLRKNDRFLREMMAANGRHMVADLRRGDVVQMRDEYADVPASAANFLKVLRSLLDYAVDLEMVERNVARDKIRGLRPKAPGGFRVWHEHEITAFLAHWPLGSLPHRALTLMLYTGAARADVVRLGWHSIAWDGRPIFTPPLDLAGRIRYQREKTRRQDEAVLIDLPILPPLAEVLATTPGTQMTFLQTRFGRQRSALSLTNDMAGWVAKAGLGARDENGRGLNCHGLRKAIGRRLAEAGCSPYEVASVLGHRNVRSSEIYTRAFSRAQSAASAAEKLAGVWDKPQAVVRLPAKKT